MTWITDEDFRRTVHLMRSFRSAEKYYAVMHPNTARALDWHCNRPLLRRLYRELGYPRGRNQGAFKRWALARGRYGL